jgi:hypothetical protein
MPRGCWMCRQSSPIRRPTAFRASIPEVPDRQRHPVAPNIMHRIK